MRGFAKRLFAWSASDHPISGNWYLDSAITSPGGGSPTAYCCNLLRAVSAQYPNYGPMAVQHTSTLNELMELISAKATAASHQTCWSGDGSSKMRVHLNIKPNYSKGCQRQGLAATIFAQKLQHITIL